MIFNYPKVCKFIMSIKIIYNFIELGYIVVY